MTPWVLLFSTTLFLAAQKPGWPPLPEGAAQAPAQSVDLGSGLKSLVLKAGAGDARPKDDSLVLVHFSGWTLDGKPFAHTGSEEMPPHVFLTHLMPGLREGLKAMVVGEQRRLWIPEALAFGGAKGRPSGPVVMDVALLEVQAHPSVAPPDVAAPPSDAQVLPSGLAFKVLRPGTGTQRPTRAHWVQVHYSGWTTDGKLFDSSLLRRETALFKMTEVIKGWTEGLQLMVPGERRRFWIPKKLAYDGASGKPAGMLVFDIELLSVSK